MALLGKILVVALHNLGDAVMSTALLPALRRLHPEAKLGLWVKDYARGLFDLPAVRLHTADPFWDTSPGRGRGSWFAFLRAVREIRSTGYECALVLDADWRRALACQWAGIPCRVGYRRRKSSLFLTQVVEEAPGRHVVEEHAALLGAWAGEPLPPDCFVPEIGLSTEQARLGVEWKAAQSWADACLVAMHPLSGDPLKNWPLPKWTQLAQSLVAGWERARIVLLSSPKEEPLLRKALSALPGDRVRLFVGAVSDIKPVLSQSGLFIGGDSGPGHMAAALGVPVVSLFGPTDPGRYRPIGRRAVAVLRRDPIRELKVEEVLKAVRKPLSAAAL